jgi:hypothetical protein
MTSIKQELDRMLQFSIAACGTVAQKAKDADGKDIVVTTDLAAATKKFLTTLASDTDKADPKEIAAKIVAAWDDKTGKLQRELDAIRLEQIGNFIVSESTFRSSFFVIESLGPDEQPWYINETMQEVRVGAMGEDGHPEQVRIVRPQERTNVGLYAIASDKARYKIMDIYRGDVSQAGLATINVARDIRIKLDRLHYNLLNTAVASGGCYGAFSYENSRSNAATRVYVPHSIIVTAQLPSSNALVNGSGTGGIGGADLRFAVRYYDPASTSASGFRPAVLMAIEDYANAWGNCLPMGAFGSRLVPTGEILVPSCDIINMARYLTMTSNTYSNVLQEQVQNQGYMKLNLNGRTWTFISDNTIPTGSCYPRFNLLPGISYSKPSWDRAFVKRDDEENWEERWNRVSWGAMLPAQNRPRGLKITYA